MTLSGRLGDVPIAEVVRLLVGRERSGTLVLRARSRRAELRFRQGTITSVRGPESRPLGRLLVELGWIDEPTLDLALRVQERVRPRRSLAEILVMTEVVGAVALRALLTEQVQEALADLNSWQEGTFEFRPDDYGSMEITHAGDLVPALELEAEAALLGQAVHRDRPLREETGVDTRPIERLAAALAGDNPAPTLGRSVAPEALDAAASLERLRRLVTELRVGLHSGTVALGLMQMLAEVVERSVLLLCEGEDLVALGAFGFGQGGRPLAMLTRGVRLRPRPGTATAEAVASGSARVLAWGDADLPGALAAAFGRPSGDEVLLLPLAGARGTIAVVVADNGDVDRPIVGLDLLELAAAQIGVALESEIDRAHPPRHA